MINPELDIYEAERMSFTKYRPEKMLSFWKEQNQCITEDLAPHIELAQYPPMSLLDAS